MNPLSREYRDQTRRKAIDRVCRELGALVREHDGQGRTLGQQLLEEAEQLAPQLKSVRDAEVIAFEGAVRSLLLEPVQALVNEATLEKQREVLAGLQKNLDALAVLRARLAEGAVAPDDSCRAWRGADVTVVPLDSGFDDGDTILRTRHLWEASWVLEAVRDRVDYNYLTKLELFGRVAEAGQAIDDRNEMALAMVDEAAAVVRDWMKRVSE